LMRLPLFIPLMIFALSLCAPAPAAEAPTPQRPLPIAMGCTGCHGESGEGFDAIPRISGTPEGDFVRKMQEFRAGKRPATVMERIARGFDDNDIAALAKYFAHK
jgi:sulfide dehydrogenase cytochrome subunit